MNKLSDRLDFIDKNIEVHNCTVDMHKNSIIREINWFDSNYNNIYGLRDYFLKRANYKSPVLNLQYANQLISYPDSKIQYMVEYRKKVLNQKLQSYENRKIDNASLKLIVQTLKLHNK